MKRSPATSATSPHNDIVPSSANGSRERTSPDREDGATEREGGSPGVKSTIATALLSQNQIVSLESVTRLFAELQTERSWIEKEMDKVFKEKVGLNTELKDVERAIEELRQQKADLEGRLAKVLASEKELKMKLDRVDAKVSSIGEESMRFERSIRSITVPPAPADSTEKEGEDGSVQTLRGHCDSVLGLGLGANNASLISGSADKSIKLWDLSRGESAVTLWGHTGWVECVQLRHGRLLSGSLDHSLRLWNAANGRCICILRGHSGGITCAQSDDVRIVSGSLDRSINVWDPDLGTCITSLSGHGDAVTCLQFFDYGLASGSTDHTVRMWDLRTGVCHRTLDAHASGVNCLQFDTQKLVTGGLDSVVKIWDLRMGEPLHVLNVRSAVHGTCFDTQHLAVAAADPAVKVYDMSTLQLKKTLTGHAKSVMAVKITSDSRLVTASADHLIKVWNL